MLAWATGRRGRRAARRPALIAAALAVARSRAPCGGRAAEAAEHIAPKPPRSSTLSRDDELGRRLDALAHLATAEFYLDRFAGRGPHAERALAIGRATGQGDLFPLIVPMLGGSLWVQGRMAEAGEVLDGAIEAARLVDNAARPRLEPLQPLVRCVRRGRHRPGARDREGGVRPRQRARRRARLLRTRPSLSPTRARDRPPRARRRAARRSAPAATSCGSIGGGWRARYLELLTRCLLAAGRRDEAEHAAAAAQACAEAVGPPDGGRDGSPRRRRARSRRRATPQRARRTGAERGSGARRRSGTPSTPRRRGCSPDERSPQAGERDRAAAELERAAAAFESFGSHRYRRRPSGSSGSSDADPPAHAPGQGRRIRRRLAHRARAPDRTTRRRPQDQPRDRSRALPQPEDGRDPPAQHVPQARRRLARRTWRAPSSARTTPRPKPPGNGISGTSPDAVPLNQSAGKGTLREHHLEYRRARGVTRLRRSSSSCAAFVPAASRACPLFPCRRSMVRRRSTVRVR